VSHCQKKSSSGLYGAREDNRGRHTNHLACATLLGLISDPPPSSPIFTPDALPAATLPVYPGLGQAPNMLDFIPHHASIFCVFSVLHIFLQYLNILLCLSVIDDFMYSVFICL